jgi:outer membrane protein OmpU
MRIRLFASTAVLVAVVTAGEGWAADGVELSIGGRYYGAAGAVFDEDDGPGESGDDTRDYVFKQDVEVHFTGKTILDNGLTVGARIELEGQTSGDQIDEVWAFFSGGFGEIRFGDDDDALEQLCFEVPDASDIFGPDDPELNFSNAGVNGETATNETCREADATRVIYFSPTFAGISFAASFAPDDSEDSRNTLDGAGTRFSNDPGDNSEQLSVALSFEHDFNGVGLALGAGGTWSFDREANVADVDELQVYNAYARVEVANVTVGGAFGYRVNVDPLIEDIDALIYGAGIVYGWDAYQIGLGWTRGEYDVASPGDEDTYDIIELTASYKLGPGITLDGVVGYVDYEDDDDAENADYSAVEAGVGFGIAF